MGPVYINMTVATGSGNNVPVSVCLYKLLLHYKYFW